MVQQAGTDAERRKGVTALNNRGVGLMGRFEYEEARKLFEQARAIEPGNPDLIVNLAIATLNRQHEGDEDRAMALLDEALRLDSDCVRATYCQGLLRLYLQSPELAQPCFERVAATDSHDAYAAYFLGQCLAQQRKHAAAILSFENAIRLDDKLRSAYYAASQAHRALGNNDAAAKMLAEFQAIERNPQARLAEFKYSRMGPKAMAQAIDDDASRAGAATRPDGPLFLDPQPLLTNGEQSNWKAGREDRAISITACDIEHDGDVDIFIADCLESDDGAGGLRNAVCINDGTGQFTLDPNHALARIADVNAALWGDFENDGLTDVYLCRRGANMLWRQSAKGVWTDMTASTRTANGEFDSVDGALFDADHDGDLDIFVVNANGPNELLNNNLDGTFKPIAVEAGIAGAGGGSRQVLPVDLDSDRDLDIIVINNQPPQEVWRNERAWRYTAASGFDALVQSAVRSVIAHDGNRDGWPELLTTQADINQPRLIWERDRAGLWTSTRHLDPPDSFGNRATLPFWIDADGSGVANLLTCDGGGCALWNDDSTAWTAGLRKEHVSMAGWGIALVDGNLGASVIGAASDGPPLIWRPSSNRNASVLVSFTGRRVTSDNRQIRSNASGIGVHYAARIGSRWVAGHTLRQSSAPGQSLQPIAIGLGGAQKIDFLSITWPDGVLQTELDLEAGKHHIIEETQRQLSSCPVLFGWDGERYRFITDALGVGGLGFLIAPGEYAPSRPWENVLLPAEVIRPRHDEYVIKLGEPMEEACYLDSAGLVAYDLPEGWDMAIDERLSVNGPEPTGRPLFYREASVRLPQSAKSDGKNVTQEVGRADRLAPDVGEIDDRFIGLLKQEQSLTLTFPPSRAAVGSANRGEALRFALLIDGWVEYPYSQTMFGASQAEAAYQAPTLELKSSTGEWHIVYEQFGYPGGMPRQMALPLPQEMDLSTAVELRIRTNQEVYFDRIALVEVEDCPEARRIDLPLTGATLSDVGFARRTNGPQRQPEYDYARRLPLWDTRHQAGWYTEFGEVDDLVHATDDALAIFGPGEEIELRFADGEASRARQDAKTPGPRRFVLELRGWCKDMDLYTKDGDTLEPLPSRGTSQTNSTRDRLHRRFNTRFQSGH